MILSPVSVTTWQSEIFNESSKDDARSPRVTKPSLPMTETITSRSIQSQTYALLSSESLLLPQATRLAHATRDVVAVTSRFCHLLCTSIMRPVAVSELRADRRPSHVWLMLAHAIPGLRFGCVFAVPTAVVVGPTQIGANTVDARVL